MRKIILDLAVTLDGFIEGENGEIDWIGGDNSIDFGDVLSDILTGVDTIFYGRMSYEIWGNYQPPEIASPKLKQAYRLLHNRKKYVFSTTKTFEGDNVVTIATGIEEAVREIRSQPGENIWLYGGGKLTTTFVNLNLIDVYRLAVYPVILGSGKPLFENIKKRVELQLLEVKSSELGVLLIKYESKRSIQVAQMDAC